MVKPATSDLGDLLDSRYRGVTALVTGHNGFVGSWLSHCLLRAGANVVGLSLSTARGGLADVTGLDELVQGYEVDVRHGAEVRSIMEHHQPHIVFHLAAQALVLPSYADPLATFDTNVMGTANLLDAVRHQPSVRACVVITSDKCYANGERPHREADPLGGDDPYSASKAAAEIVAHSYRSSFLKDTGVGLATARAGNIVGGGDWGDHRIVPDCMRAAAAHVPLELRHRGAVRPWQHVLDAVAGYLRLGAALLDDASSFSRAWNFGPGASSSATVGDLVEALLDAWSVRDVLSSLRPIGPTAATPHERAQLTLDSTQAHRDLSWTPLLSLWDIVEWTVDWYWSFLHDDQADHRQYTLAQIEQFILLDKASAPREASMPKGPPSFITETLRTVDEIEVTT